MNIDVPMWLIYLLGLWVALECLSSILDVILFNQKRRLNGIEVAAIKLVQARNNLNREFKAVSQSDKGDSNE